MKTLADEREREIGEKEQRLRRQKEEREELIQKNGELEALLAKAKEKNAKLKAALADITSTLRKSTEEREALFQSQEQSFQQRLQSQIDTLNQQKEVEMADFRIKISTEISQSFSAKVQSMTTEHEMTVTRLMEALLEKQKQEQQLIELVQKEQEEVRKLKMERAMYKEEEENPAEDIEEAKENESNIHASDLSFPSITLPVESPKETPSLPLPTYAEVSPLAELTDPLNQRSDSPPLLIDNQQEITNSDQKSDNNPNSDSEPDPSEQFEQEEDRETTTPDGGLFLVLSRALKRMARKTTVMKLSRKGKQKKRDVWVEGAERLVNNEGEGWRQELCNVRIVWSTTSRFKRPANISFHFPDIEALDLSQASPGFRKNPSLEDCSNRSLWVKFRKIHYFEVVFEREEEARVWEAGLKVGKLVVTYQEPSFSLWKAFYDLFVGNPSEVHDPPSPALEPSS